MLASEAGEWNNVGFHQILYRNRVDLDGSETQPARNFQPLQNLLQFVAPRDPQKTLPVQRIQVNVEPAQASVVQRLGMLRQLDAIRGHRKIANSRNSRKHAYQHRKTLAHQRLTSGDSQFRNTERNRHAHKSLNLFERQDFRVLHVLHAFFRHAVEAADIAPVRNTDPKIVVNSTESVQQGVSHVAQLVISFYQAYTKTNRVSPVYRSSMFRPFYLALLVTLSFFCVSNAQTILTCSESTVPPVVKGEGIAERTGDLVLACSGGAPGAMVTGNLSIFLSVNITNRVIGNTAAGINFTIDNGSGPQPVNTPGTITAPGTLMYNGLSFALSSTGTATLRIANIRADANQLQFQPNTSVQAFIGFNTNLLSMSTDQFAVATPVYGLYAGSSTALICEQHGSPLPENLQSVKSFLASQAAFSSTRLTEGFASAFAQRSAFESLNADTGTRFIMTYSGFPQGARLFVPQVVAGSDTVKPTAGGDLGVPASGGQYAPSAGGSLLLSLVQGTDANGAGGSVLYTPGMLGSGTVSFDAMNELTFNNGTAIAVYEVVDANSFVQETAQFPTFLGLTGFSGDPVVTTETVSLAPVSTVTTATAHDPIPRFEAITPPADCDIIGDCNASYYPHLYVNTTPITLTAASGGNFQVGYSQVNNRGGGHMEWTASITYTNGSGWIEIDPSSGIDNATIRVETIPTNLVPGTYQATLTVDAGAQAGSMTVPITFVVTAPAPPPAPTVSSIVNAATFVSGPSIPGSIVTLLGTNLAGKNVTVTFGGMPAQVLFDSSTQINVLVPSGLGSQTSAQLIVVVDGNQMAPQTVPLAEFAPGIFKNGILNQDGSVNGPSHAAKLPSVLQIFATGLSGNGSITARINGTAVDPAYGGPAPGIAGVQQVNVPLPAGLAGTTAAIEVCGAAMCSPAVQVTIAQ